MLCITLLGRISGSLSQTRARRPHSELKNKTRSRRVTPAVRAREQVVDKKALMGSRKKAARGKEIAQSLVAGETNLIGCNGTQQLKFVYFSYFISSRLMRFSGS